MGNALSSNESSPPKKQRSPHHLQRREVERLARLVMTEQELKSCRYTYQWVSQGNNVASIDSLAKYVEFPEAFTKRMMTNFHLNATDLHFYELLHVILMTGKDSIELKDLKERYFFNLFSSDENEMSREEANQMFTILKELSLETIQLIDESVISPKTTNWVEECIIKGLFYSKTSDSNLKSHITFEEFWKWQKKTVPFLFRVIETRMYQKFQGRFQEPYNGQNHDPILETIPHPVMPLIHETDPNLMLTQEVAWILSAAIPLTNDYLSEVMKHKIFEWQPLYFSYAHGFSLNVLQNKIFDYPGASIMLLQDRSGLIFGVYAPMEWKAQKISFWGDKNTFLFELSPIFEVSRAIGPNKHYIFFNPEISRNGVSGLGFGGETKNFRTYVDANLQNGHYGGKGETFEQLFEREELKIKLDVVKIEVWGLGGERAAKSQRGQKDWENRQILKRRTPKKTEWDIDRSILEMGRIDISF